MFSLKKNKTVHLASEITDDNMLRPPAALALLLASLASVHAFTLRPCALSVRAPITRAHATAALGPSVAVGDALEVSVDVAEEEEEERCVWAAATVRSVDAGSGEFMVTISEWDDLPKDDPEYSQAYEEGPYTEDDEGEEWRRPAAVVVEVEASASTSTPIPPGAIVFDKAKHEAYDYEAEANAAEEVVRVLGTLQRFGLDDADKAEWPALRTACEALERATRETPAPCLRDDPRLIGDCARAHYTHCVVQAEAEA